MVVVGLLFPISVWLHSIALYTRNAFQPPFLLNASKLRDISQIFIISICYNVPFLNIISQSSSRWTRKCSRRSAVMLRAELGNRLILTMYFVWDNRIFKPGLMVSYLCINFVFVSFTSIHTLSRFDFFALDGFDLFICFVSGSWDLAREVRSSEDDATKMGKPILGNTCIWYSCKVLVR